MKLVTRKTPATTSKIMPKVPVIIFVKNKIAITNATIIRIVLSTFPMFFFMSVSVLVNTIYCF